MKKHSTTEHIKSSIDARDWLIMVMGRKEADKILLQAYLAGFIFVPIKK